MGLFECVNPTLRVFVIHLLAVLDHLLGFAAIWTMEVPQSYRKAPHHVKRVGDHRVGTRQGSSLPKNKKPPSVAKPSGPTRFTSVCRTDGRELNGWG